MRILNLLILFGIGEDSLNSRKSRSAALSYMKADGQGVVINKASSLAMFKGGHPVVYVR
jgi:hypothetical protein